MEYLVGEICLPLEKALYAAFIFDSESMRLRMVAFLIMDREYKERVENTTTDHAVTRDERILNDVNKVLYVHCTLVAEHKVSNLMPLRYTKRCFSYQYHI